MKLVEVEWVDSISHCDQPWRTPEELRGSVEPNVCHTAGYLFEDEDQVTIVMSHGSYGTEVGMALTIPRVAIRRILPLTRELPPIMAM